MNHQVFKAVVAAPVGNFIVEACEVGIHRIQRDFGDSKREEVESKVDNETLDKAVEWLGNYFQSHPTLDWNRDPDKYPPICWDALGLTEFGKNVLQTATQKITFGQTLAYSELAVLIGKQGASRAVGTALKNNPILILVPCHRIVRADGSYGKYAGGDEVKEWLLGFEKDNK